MATKLGDIYITKQSGTVLTLNTKDKFVNDDLTFNIGATPDNPSFTGGTLTANATIQSLGNNVVLHETTNNGGIIVQSYYTASTTDVTYANNVNGYVVKSSGTVARSGQDVGPREGKRYSISEITVPAATSFKVTTDTYGNQIDTSHPLTIINGGFRYVNVYNNVGSYSRVDVTNRGTVNVYPYSTSEGNIYVVGAQPSGSYMGQTIVTDGKWVNTDVASSGTYYGRVNVPGGTYTANTPTVNASGFVTATTTITAGYIPASTPTSSLQLPTQAAQTIIPTTTDQTIASGKYLTGTQTITGDANLKPENIKAGASIFGVTGTYAGVVPIITETEDSHGGTVIDITTDKEYSWRGIGIEFVQNAASYNVALADTSFATWTPSNTSTTIKNSSSAGTFVADMANYDYFIEWKVWIDVVYNDGATLKSTPKTQLTYIYQPIFRKPDNVISMSKNISDRNSVTSLSARLEIYYNSAGQISMVDTSYGLFANPSAPTFSNNFTDNPTITIYTPMLKAYCNSDYFNTARAAEIDQTNSVFHVRGKVYRCKPGTFFRGVYGEALTNLYNERGEL